MRKIIILIAFLSVKLLSAQTIDSLKLSTINTILKGEVKVQDNYEPLIDTTKQWNILQHEYWFCKSDNLKYINTIGQRFRGDTVINETHYTFLETCKNDPTFTNWQKSNYYFREDTINGKVYLFADNSEQLLYDFSLEVGDSLAMNDFYLHVDSVKTELIAGKNRKVIYFEDLCEPLVMIEGIGTFYDLLKPYRFCYVGVTLFNKLACFSQNGETLYQDEDECFRFEDHSNEIIPSPIVDTNKIWSVITSYASPNGGWGVGTSSYKLAADSIINEQKYFKVYEKRDTLDTPWIFNKVLLRQDSLKVYIKQESGAERLLYDFSLQVDDIIMQSNMFFNEQEWYVKEVTYAMMDGKMRKIIILDSEFGWEKDVWIQGIGSMFGILTPGNLVYDLETKMLCVHKNDQLIYSNSEFDGCYIRIVGIEDQIADNDINIYPNPVSDKLHINFENEPAKKAEIRIYSCQGRLIKTKAVGENSQIDIDFSQFKSGLYLMHYSNVNGNVFIKQIIKE